MLKTLASFLRNYDFSEKAKYLLRKVDRVVQKYDLCKQNLFSSIRAVARLQHAASTAMCS